MPGGAVEMGSGKSGIDAVEEAVWRDEGVGGIELLKLCSESLTFWGWYWKTGVGSCTRELSKIDGTWLGRGGR